MQNNNTNISSEALGVKYAGFGIRFLAYAIDNLILGAGLLIVKFFIFIVTNVFGLNLFSTQILFQYTLSDIVFYILRVLYFVLMTYYTSATLGKHMLKIKVISTNKNGKYTFVDILYRETIGRFLSKLIIYAGYFLVFINKDKSSLHDMLADTRVIYKDSEGEEKVNIEENNNYSPDSTLFDYIQIDETDDKVADQADTNL